MVVGVIVMPKNKNEYQYKYEAEKIDTISFKAAKGSRPQLKKAAAASGKSINGFIRDTLNAAVMETIGEPMEPEKEKSGES
jgi:uncharacterized protein (DUF1778 family)